MASNSNLVCKECGYVNEAERVYCHSCGAKLDRSVILAEQEKNELTPEERHRQIKKMMTPKGSSFVLREFSMLFKVIVWSLAAAVVILMILAPGDVPALPKKGEVVALPQLGDDLDRLAQMPAGQGYLFREADINIYLLKKPFRKVPSWFTDIIPLRRSFVNLADGNFRLTLQADVAGYPLYIGLTGQPKSDPKTGLSVEWTGLYIGRLTLPGVVAQQAALVLPTVFDSVKHEAQALSRLGSLDITKGQLILRSRGPQAAAPYPVGARPVGH